MLSFVLHHTTSRFVQTSLPCVSSPSIRRPSPFTLLFEQDPRAALGIEEQRVHLADILNVDLVSAGHLGNDRSWGEELQGISIKQVAEDNKVQLRVSPQTQTGPQRNETHLNELFTPSSASLSKASGLTSKPSTLHLVSKTCLTSSRLYGYVLTIMHLSRRSIGIPCGLTIPA
jgi:hypothetical protein